LKERGVGVLAALDIRTTFKIPESSFVYMKISVEGLTQLLSSSASEEKESKVIKVEVPESKIPVVCLDTGKTQFLSAEEKVEIILLQAEEITEKGESV
ncbi:MAG: hypothetical protein ACTSPB_15760, partial [Candidatus Thorarchaeota archaeon]